MRNGNKKFHLSWKHGIALLLAVVLLMTTMMPSALGTGSGGTTPPKITVVSTVVSGDTRTVEVGLSINSASQLFQSAGVLLKYDSSVLTLIDWDVETLVNVTMDGATPVVVPTKGAGKAADKSVGKLAETSESATAGTNYLFLSSEMLKAEAINQALPEASDHSGDTTNYPTATGSGKAVTYTDEAKEATDQTVVVRFRVNDGTPGTDAPKTLAQLVKALDVVGVTAGNIDAVKTFPLSKVLADADAVNYFANNTDHTTAGLTSSSDVAFHWIAKGVTANSGAGGGYSVLFNLMGGKAIIQENKAANPGDPDQWEDKATEADVTGTLFAAIPDAMEGDEVALPTQTLGAKERLIFRMGDGESARDFTSMTFLGTDGNTYTYGDGWKINEMPENGVALTAQWAADPADFFSIVFYDWCGVEVLGSTTVAKVADATEQQRLVDEAMEKFAISQMSADDAAAYQADGFDPANGTAHPEDGKPLSNKKGYTFSKWIPLGTEYGSSYGGAVTVNDTLTTATVPEPAGYEFAAADYATGALVKAAYCTNQDLAGQLAAGASATARNYSVSVANRGYTRYGTSSNYSITYTIKRENADVGVPRVRKLGIRVSLTIPGLTDPVLMLQELDNQDEVQTIVAVNDQVTSVNVEVIDLCDDTTLGGSSDWVSAAARSMATADATGANHSGFIAQGNVGFINELLSKATNVAGLGDLGPGHLSSAELSTATVHGSPNPFMNLPTAKTNLLTMYQSLPDDKKAAGLTWDDMQQAIKYGTTWDSTAGAWTGGYTGTFAG